MINHLALLWLLIAACCGVAPAVADQALPSAGAAGPGQAGEPTPHREPYQPPAPVAPPGPELDGGSSPSSDSEGQDDPAPGAGTAGAPAEAKDQQPVSDSGAEEPLPLRDLRTFAEVFGRIKSDYVEEVDDHELLSSAIRGMLGGLDPHSAYLDPEAYSELKVGTSGEFGGLGIEVGIEDGLVKVISPIDNTPAERAGMQAGDLIVRIDGKPIKGMDLSEAVKLMRGKPGTTIELTVVREGEGSPLTIKIERDIIKVASVKGRTLEPGFGYLRIANFQARTTDDLLKAVATLKEDNEDGLNGVVLDLRNNPGGVLNAAVGVSDAFLERGLIVYTQGRVEDSRLEFRAGPDDVLDGAPIVVLVNGGS
ncbi:MAG: S41 family peptidase, partial [Thiohalocapsa sp.]